MEIKTEIRYRAIHMRVLIVYVATIPQDNAGWPGDWAAYCVPVSGLDHKSESKTWRHAGTKLREDEARALWPAVAADFDAAGIKWRP
jgi:hypothetical protein